MLFILACAVFNDNNAQEKGEEPSLAGIEPSSEPSDNPVEVSSEPSSPTAEPSAMIDTAAEPSSENNEFDCSAELGMVSPESSCFTQELRCGDVVLMSTDSGTSYYDGALYTSWYEMPNHSGDYTGREHAFYFWHPGSDNSTQYRIDITVESLCENMDLFYFQLPSTEAPACYDEAYSLGSYSHESSQKNSLQDDSLPIYDSNPNLYLLIVESRDGEPAPFRITVDCG